MHGKLVICQQEFAQLHHVVMKHCGQVCQIFSVVYGQNGCFLKKIWPKMQNVFTMAFYMIIGNSKCTKALSFCRKDLVWPRQQVLTLKQQFCHELRISHYNLSFVILVKITTIYQTLF